MQLTAKDVMSKYALVTIRPGATLEELDHLLVENQISGVPVVNADREVLGVVSRGDLVSFLHDEMGGSGDFYGSEKTKPIDREDGELRKKLRSRSVADIMPTRLYSVNPDTPITEVAGMMRHHRIHRVLVVEGAKLVGLISAFDLLGFIEDPKWRLYWEETEDLGATEVEFTTPRQKSRSGE